MFEVKGFQHDKHIYTIRKRSWKVDRTDPMYDYKYTGFIDGEVWRQFRTRKDFLKAVELQPDDFHLGRHARETEIAEMISTTKGAELLDRIIARCRALKAKLP